MNSDLILSIFSFYAEYLPKDWLEFSIFYKFDEHSNMTFVKLLDVDGDVIRPEIILNAGDSIELSTLIERLAHDSSLGTGTVTHLELRMEQSGKFQVQMGYGDIDWENMWPDDLDSNSYTYKNMGASF